MLKGKPILKISLRYGGMGAALSAVLFIILFYSGKNPFLIPAMLDFRILVFPIILLFGIRDFKENINGGYLHFWEGMSVGLLEIFVFSFLMLLFILAFGSLIETGLVDQYITDLQEQIIAGKERFSGSIGEEAYSKTLEILPSTTIFDLALDYFLKSWPLGLFLIIILTLIFEILRVT
ncbi:DUF4199 domain-containing protein, partial [Bacteroidota bacterium]